MGKTSAVPLLGTPEFEQEKEFYLKSTTELRKQRAKQLGYDSVDSYIRAMLRRGLHTPKVHSSLNYKPPSPNKQVSPDSLTPEETKILAILKDRPVSVSELSRQLDRSSETIIKLIDKLREKHYQVILDEKRKEVVLPHEPAAEFQPTDFKYFRKFYRIGLVSDTHIGSKYSQMTLLHDVYNIFDERKTDFNIHAGDVFDGVNMYPGHSDELFLHDAKSQREYAKLHYPKSKRKDVKTYMISGQHDYCFMKQNGYDIMEHLCSERDDLVYRGFFKADFLVKEVRIGLQHPGGGTAYSRSYRLQKIIENLMGYTLSIIRENPENINQIPAMIFFGHWHVTCNLPNYMGIDVVALPCLQSQTKYLQQHGLMPCVGCAVAEIWLNDKGGLSSSKIEFVNMNGQIRTADY